MFHKYHGLFEGNAHLGQRYQLILTTGQVLSGIPVAKTGVDNSGSFSNTLDTGNFREVEWNRLLTASAIG